MIALSVKIYFLSLICFFTLIEPIFAQNQFEFSGKRDRELLNFKKARGLVVLPMYINNKGPFNFILDSGVGLIVITDPHLKDSLNLQYLRKMDLTGLGSDIDLTAFSTPFLNLRIGTVIAKSCSAAILEKDILNLSGYAGMPIHGLIGYDFFKSFIVRINYDAGIIKIYKNQIARLINKGHKIPISIEGNKPYVDVMVNAGEKTKIPLKMLVDTGSGNPVSLESYKEDSFPLPDQFVIANLGVGLSGNIRGFKGRIGSLKIGKFNIDSIITSFPYFEDIAAKITSVSRNGSLGNPFFNKFDVLFDYQNSCIYLKPSISYKEPYEHDMSGMEIFASGDEYNRYFVTRVERGSPADDFGVRIGDEIVGLNFSRSNKLTIDEITKIFSSREGRNLYIEVARGEEVFAGILTLKRRI